MTCSSGSGRHAKPAEAEARGRFLRYGPNLLQARRRTDTLTLLVIRSRRPFRR
ncbi:MAG: hypothetical protein M1325_04710 [Actinobacteria bacterium]|nr:hypothetical protein [Actinomycetota bacterium]